MSDILLMDVERAVELRRHMTVAADELDFDAQALTGPLSEASHLLGRPVPDVQTGTRRIADDLRGSALDLQERTRIVLAGGPELNEGLAALERIRSSFTMIESRGDPGAADGILSRRDLQWARHSADEATAEAAGWLLDHSRFFDQVETAAHNDDYMDRPYDGEFAFDPDDRDGHMSRADIDAFLEKTTAWSTLLPHVHTIDSIQGDGPPDGVLERRDVEAFLNDYDLSPEVAGAVRRVLDDGAYHRSNGRIGLGTVLDAVSFVPVIGDVVDGARAIYYAVHGDYATASLFALGLVPLPGLSASGIRGAIKVVDAVAGVARKSGTRAAVKEAGQRGMKGTAANYAAYESTKQAGRAFGDGLDVGDSVEYALDDVLGDRIEGALGEELDPRMRELLGEQLEDSLEDRLDSGTRDWLTEANQMIARRIAEHHAHDMTFRRLRFR